MAFVYIYILNKTFVIFGKAWWWFEVQLLFQKMLLFYLTYNVKIILLYLCISFYVPVVFSKCIDKKVY